MDRDKNKLGVKRGSNKIKPTLFPSGDFIALGSKSTRGPTEVAEPKSQSKPSGSSTISERKRDVSSPSSSSSSIPPKKSKLSNSPSSTLSLPLARTSSQSKRDTVKNEGWDSVATDVEPAELLNKIIEAEDQSEDERVESLICGAVKSLKNSRLKPEASQFLTLMFLAKTRPHLFSSDLVLEAFCSLLKRDITANVKSKGSVNNLLPLLACNILLSAYHETLSWPEDFVKTYVEDSLGDRIWVDSEECKGFINNIMTAFGTILPPKSMMATELTFKPDACPSPPTGQIDEDEASSSSLSLECRESLENITIIPRYKHNRDIIEKYVLDMVHEHLARRQPMEVSRNMLRLLISTCGLSEIRLLVSQKLEIWLQNPKLTRPAQDLLSSICLNCTQHSQQDVEVIAQLIRIRLKSKPIINHFLQCMKELLKKHQENLSTVLKHAIYNELSTSRNPNNMQLLAIIFQHSPEKAAKVLADVFLDLLTKRDDYLRALRVLFREIVRTIRHDLNHAAFCLALMQERRDAAFKELEPTFKERMFFSIVDIVVLDIFMAISPSVREAALAYVRGEKKDLPVLRNYQSTVMIIQRDCVWWLHSVVPKMFNPGRIEFMHCIHKVVFLEQMEHYYNKDNWPPEGDRNMILRLASEVPVLEDTIIRILVIGLSRVDFRTDALELADKLIKRAASLYTEDSVVLSFENRELFEIIFKLCAYHHPENISLPTGYKPPNLAIAECYWKAWIMLLVIVAHNPSTFGLIAWEKYPTLHNFMEMCVTNYFVFPPATVASGDKAEEIRAREIQIAQLEKQDILQFESHLAAASTKVAITESNSLLLSKLVSMDPLGGARRPPLSVLEQVKALNQSLKLGHLLCRSRKPDFLLDIIQRQGTSQSMPWLAELVESSEGSFSMLPVQCLCEFLLNDPPAEFENLGDADDDVKTDKSKAKKRLKQEQLLRYLQNLLHNTGSSPDDSQSTKEVLDYFLRRLSSQQLGARSLAIKGLRMVLSQPNKSPEISDDEESTEQDSDNQEFSWLLKSMPSLEHFDSVRAAASLALRQACQVENDPVAVSSFVKFLAEFAPMENLQDVSDLALDMAQLIVERPTIVNCILPPPPNPCTKESPFLTSVTAIFIRYLQMAKIPSREAYSWSESQDHILVQWSGGEAATMRILVVHAMVIVLTYGPPYGDQAHFKELLETWFPTHAPSPQAFLVDTSEEALLQPDWLKLRMLRSSVEVLVDSALKDLDSNQLILFVQSFGIPVYNMSKLLLLLDVAVQMDSYSVDQAIVDKKYMAQLVEVQHQRGATGGDQFSRLLGDYDMGVPVVAHVDSANTTSVIQKTPRQLPSRLTCPQIEPQMIQTAMLQLFKLTEGRKLMDFTDQEIFKGLQKSLSQDILMKRSDHPHISAFADACYGITRGSMREAFAVSVLEKTSYSSVLFRLATAAMSKKKPERPPTTERLLDACRSICLCAKNIKSPLTTILKQFMKGFDDGCFDYTNKDRWRLLMENLLSSKTEWNSQHVIDIIRAVAKGNKHRLEEVTLEIVKAGIQQGKVQDLLEALTSVVMNSNLTPEMSRYHLFVDLISQLEPEVIGRQGDIHRERQKQLLFGKDGGSSSPESPFPFRPFLLALLIHQSNWQTLQESVNLVLQKSDSTSSIYDSSSVLDFLWACIHIPKIWQGKDKRKPKHYNEEDVLVLNEEQLISVADYIVMESLAKLDILETDWSNIAIDPIVAYRLPLLVRCCCNRMDHVSAVADHLLEFTVPKSGNIENPKHVFIVKQLLLQMYLEMPSIFRVTSVLNNVLDHAKTLRSNCSKLDVISHTLLISMATTDSSKQCTERMEDLNLALRKLASSHPYLLLRQLPMISSLLQGRVQLDYVVFRARNHLTFFINILGLLDLLAPQILLQEFREDLTNIFNCYLELFETHSSQTSDLVSLFNRFLTYLKSCLAVNPASVKPCIQKNLSCLHELPPPYQELAVFKALLAGTTWMHRAEETSVTPDRSSNVEATKTVPKTVNIKVEESSSDNISSIMELWSSTQRPGWTQFQLAPLSARLNQEGNFEDVVAALQDLENLSNRKPNILDYFLDDLKTLIQNRNLFCRQTAFNLLLKHLRNKPQSASQLVTAVLQCLENLEHDVIQTALQHLPEIVVLAQEYAAVLLQKAFAVGISTNINSAPQICETLLLLNVQTGS